MKLNVPKCLIYSKFIRFRRKPIFDSANNTVHYTALCIGKFNTDVRRVREYFRLRLVRALRILSAINVKTYRNNHSNFVFDALIYNADTNLTEIRVRFELVRRLRAYNFRK